MKKQILLLNLSVLFLFSCTGSERIDEELHVNTELLSNTLTNKGVSDTNYITPIIFTTAYSPGAPGKPACYSYDMYVASDVLSTKNRVVNVQFIKSNSIVEYKILTIPAESHISQTVQVFVNKPQTYGGVLMKVVSVKIDNVLTNEYNLNSIETVVENCNTSIPALPGAPDCKDTNDNGILDCYESH